jgi:cytidylate kinase
MQKYGVDELKARYMAEEHDYTREVYTRTFTGKDKYDARNYDLSVNVGSFGVNGAVDFLMKIIDA